jgi:hypothetical protein
MASPCLIRRLKLDLNHSISVQLSMSAPPKATEHKFDPSNPRSQRGKSHIAALRDQAGPPKQLYTGGSWLTSWPVLFIGIFLSVLFGLVVNVIVKGNLFVTLHPHDFENCLVVRGPVGAEDIVIDRTHNALFASADARTWIPSSPPDSVFTRRDEVVRRMANMTREEQGGIWALDTATTNVGLDTQAHQIGRMVKLELVGYPWQERPDFHPHGISLTVGTKSNGEKQTFLYVINHARYGDFIDIFRVVGQSGQFPPRLEFEGSLSDPVLMGLNDLHALHPLWNSGKWEHAVYSSIFLGSKIGDLLWCLIEVFTVRPWGSLALCTATTSGAGGLAEDVRCTHAIKGLSGPKWSQYERGPNGVVSQQYCTVQTYSSKSKSRPRLPKNLSKSGLGVPNCITSPFHWRQNLHFRSEQN